MASMIPSITLLLLISCLAFAHARRSLLQADTVNLCAFYKDACDQLLNDLACDDGSRKSRSCQSSTTSLDKWSPECKCAKLDATERVLELTHEHLAAPDGSIADQLVIDGDGNPDVCATYSHVCIALLDRIACPNSKREKKVCGNSASLTKFEPKCKCGKADFTKLQTKLVVDVLLKEDLGGLL